MKIENIVYSKTFKSCYKSLKKKHYDMSKFETVVDLIVDRNEAILISRYRDHPLKGGLKGIRELHIDEDWLLTYRINNDMLELFLIAMGSHDDVFRKSKYS